MVKRGYEKKLRETYMKGLVRSVIEKEPTIKEEEIKIMYKSPLLIRILFGENSLLSIAPSYKFSFFLGKRVKSVRAKIIVGPNFLEESIYTHEEKKAAMAHELLGHYKRDKRRKTREIVSNCSSLKLQLGGIMKKRHNINRLKKWSLLDEIYADNAAADAGHGKNILSFLRKMEDNEKLLPRGKEEIAIRIASLEERLGLPKSCAFGDLERGNLATVREILDAWYQST